MSAHLNEERKEDGQFENVEREFTCTWGECIKYQEPTKMHLHDFARHLTTHISAMLPGKGNVLRQAQKPWIIPASTMAISYEETLTVRDERNPAAPPQAAGIPLSAVLILRNIARNVVKTDAEEELIKERAAQGEVGGWNERLFRPVLPRLFEILAENKAMSPYIASLLELTRLDTPEDPED